MANFSFGLNMISAMCALISVYYWYESAMTKLPSLGADGKPEGPISMLEINKAIIGGARANKIAAAWTGLAVLLAALANIVALFSSNQVGH